MKKTEYLIIMGLLFALVAGCGKQAHVGNGKQPDAAGHANEEGEHATKGSVTIGEESKSAMGLTLEPVAYRSMEETLSVTGEIAKDTEKIFHVTPPAAGEVARIDVRYYDAVRQGDVLGAINTGQSADDIIAPHSGIVTAITVNQGQHADQITSLFTIADLSVISANFDVYEKDAGKIRVGQKIKVRSMAYPGKIFHGRLVFISPRVDERSRTIKVRAEIDNSGYLLKFNMFVTGEIIISAGQFLAVPSKAVQKVDDKEIVFVAKGNNAYAACPITSGFEADGYVRVLAGLRQGASIAVDGSFLLKSELLKAEMGDGCAE